MKKKLKIIIPCIVLIVLIIAGSVTYSFLPHSLNYDIKAIEKVGSDVEVIEKTVDTVTVKKADDSNFKVLMFTDIHLDGKNETSNMTVENLVKDITKEKPDLVILGGDNVTSGLNRTRSKQLGQIFEQLGVYWAGVIGNHEGDNGSSISRTEMMNIFTSFDHCLMLKGPDDIWGDCNYSLNILNSDDTLKKTFYFLDTGNDALPELIEKYNVKDEDRHLYDGVKEDQIKWYSDKVVETVDKYGDNESIMVVHIPLFQMREAAETETYLYGDKREGVCSSCYDTGLFDAIKAGGSTKAVYFGHDHVNNFAIELDGITLSYIEQSGYGSYNLFTKTGAEEKDWLQGYTMLNINSDGVYSHQFVRRTENMQ